MQIKKCFTINQNRTTSEFNKYSTLIKKGLFQAVEVFYPYDKTPSEINTYRQNVIDLMKYNIEIVLHLPHGIDNDLCYVEERNQILKRNFAAIDFARSFNAKKLTLHLGGSKALKFNTNRNELIELSIENVKILCDYAYPMNIMIENMPCDNEIGYSPDEIKYIIEKAAKSNVKFILDFGHANVSSYDTLEYINTLEKYLYHLHISDNDSTTDQHKPIGTGNIDFKYLFKKIKFYNELYCLEIIYNDEEDLIKYEEALIDCIND